MFSCQCWGGKKVCNISEKQEGGVERDSLQNSQMTCISHLDFWWMWSETTAEDLTTKVNSAPPPLFKFCFGFIAIYAKNKVVFNFSSKWFIERIPKIMFIFTRPIRVQPCTQPPPPQRKPVFSSDLIPLVLVLPRGLIPAPLARHVPQLSALPASPPVARGLKRIIKQRLSLSL